MEDGSKVTTLCWHPKGSQLAYVSPDKTVRSCRYYHRLREGKDNPDVTVVGFDGQADGSMLDLSSIHAAVFVDAITGQEMTREGLDFSLKNVC